MLNASEIEKTLISEIRLTPQQAKIFLLVNIEGRMTVDSIAKRLKISKSESLASLHQLVELGAFIELSKTEFEAMHPRFTAVNMYRRMCIRENIEFKRNKIVDMIGPTIERAYEAARTK